MRVEWPELKRCCCCMPLRHGLITWGYIRLIFDLFLAAMVTNGLVSTYRFYERYPENSDGYIEDLLFMSFFLTALLVDIGFTLVFLIGGHRKSAQLLHVYYIYSLVSLGLNVLANIGMAVTDIMMIQNILKFAPDINITPFVFFMRSRLVFGIFFIGIHVYSILLIRSEAVKLRNRSKYRYTNPLPEVQGSVENGTINRGDSAAVETPINEPEAQFKGVIDQTNNDTFTYKKF